MSILNESRYKGNLAWVGQLLHNDGFNGLAKWIKTLPQHDKEDVRFMIELMSREITKLSKDCQLENDNIQSTIKKTKPNISKIGMQGLADAEKIIRMKPKLYLIKPLQDSKYSKNN